MGRLYDTNGRWKEEFAVPHQPPRKQGRSERTGHRGECGIQLLTLPTVAHAPPRLSTLATSSHNARQSSRSSADNLSSPAGSRRPARSVSSHQCVSVCRTASRVAGTRSNLPTASGAPVENTLIEGGG